MVLCSRCKATVVLTNPNERPLTATTSRQPSTTATMPIQIIGAGQHQRVFDRLSPQTRIDGPSSARRRLDFDAPFYNEDYYARNSSSSSSFANQKTFKLPEPRDQRWYSYNSTTNVYTALSKSKKRGRQRIDSMARRQVAQATSAPKW